MNALGTVVLDKKIINCILKHNVLTPLSTYSTSQNGFNNFVRGPPKDYSCEILSKFTVQFMISHMKFSLYNSILNCDCLGVVNFDPRGII